MPIIGAPPGGRNIPRAVQDALDRGEIRIDFAQGLADQGVSVGIPGRLMAQNRYLVDWTDTDTYNGPRDYADLRASGLFLRARLRWGSEDTGGTYRTLAGVAGEITLQDTEGLFNPGNEESPFLFYPRGGAVSRNRAEFRHKLLVTRSDIPGAEGDNVTIWAGWLYPPDDTRNAVRGEVRFPVRSRASDHLRKQMYGVASLERSTLAREVRRTGDEPEVHVVAGGDRVIPPYRIGNPAAVRGAGLITRREFLRRLSYAAAADSYETEHGAILFDPVDTPRTPVNLLTLRVREVEIDSTTRRPITDVELRATGQTRKTQWEASTDLKEGVAGSTSVNVQRYGTGF